MTKRHARGLRPEERRLWESYAEGMKPRVPGRKEDPERTLPEISPHKSTPPPDPLPMFRVGQSAQQDTASVAITSDPPVWERPRRIDGKTFGKMKKGRVSPDARIDLHGMTVDQAHSALTSFVLSRQVRGDRLLLVITGKGSGEGPVPRERGILRRQVPHWLTLPPLAGVVLDIAPAHRRHGGDGAYYVYLRRLR